MSKELVKLPREVAEAIGYFRDNVAIEHWEQAILKVAMEDVKFIGRPDYCHVIKEYVKSIDNLRVFLKAIANGYEVEITPEDKVREVINHWELRRSEHGERSQVIDYDKFGARLYGARCVLEMLNIKIDGVNT